MFSHSRLAEIRQAMFHLATNLKQCSGATLTTCGPSRLEASSLGKHLERLHDDAHCAWLAQPAETRGTAGGNTAARAALSHFKALETWGMPIEASAPAIQHWGCASETRTPAPAPMPKIGVLVHCELGVVDPTQTPVMQGLYALTALWLAAGIRTPLAGRSGSFALVENGVGIDTAGCDWKKRGWRTAGRPIPVDTMGVTVSDKWWRRAIQTLESDGFDQQASMLHHHDGAGGDPRRATKLLTQPVFRNEWQVMFRTLLEHQVSPCPSSGAAVCIAPSLAGLKVRSQALTAQSAKHFMITG